MNVLDFINSSALREHLKSIGYQFSGFEAAWLVWNCRSATLDEKLAAWDEIMRACPDEEYPNPQQHYAGLPNFLHATLWDYSAYIKKTVDFIKEKPVPGEYFYTVKYKKVSGGKMYLCAGFLGTYEAALQNALEMIAGYGKGASAVITKLAPEPKNEEWELTVDRFGIIKDAHSRGVSFDEGYKDISICFENMRFSFPTPFKKGDILYDPERVDLNSLWSRPFVLKESATEISQRLGKPLRDGTDVIADGLFLDSVDMLYCEDIRDYTSLEYFPEEKLTGRLRLLRALSGFVKGDIDEVLFANAYAFVLADERAKEIKKRIKTRYTKKDLRLAGIDG